MGQREQQTFGASTQTLGPPRRPGGVHLRKCLHADDIHSWSRENLRIFARGVMAFTFTFISHPGKTHNHRSRGVPSWRWVGERVSPARGGRASLEARLLRAHQSAHKSHSDVNRTQLGLLSWRRAEVCLQRPQRVRCNVCVHAVGRDRAMTWHERRPMRTVHGVREKRRLKRRRVNRRALVRCEHRDHRECV